MPWICSNVTATEGNPLSILPENLLSKINIIDPQAKKKEKRKGKKRPHLCINNNITQGTLVCLSALRKYEIHIYGLRY